MQPGASDDTHAHGARPRRPLVLGGLVLAAVLSPWGLRLNIEPSVPRGFYGLGAVQEPLSRGTLVVLPVPTDVQRFHARWVPLLKPVAGIAGDVACVWGETLWLWTAPGAAPVAYGMVWRAAQGALLPRMEDCVVIAEQHVFVASAARNSLDSRYFGPRPLSSLTAQAIPLLTWR